jgi:hypothetical protein
LSNRVYVFGAIREKQPQNFGTIQLNLENRPVFTIHHQNVGMVICTVEDEVMPSRNNLFAHQTMISKIMEKYDVIPMSFGNVFSSEEDVLYITKHLYDELEQLFPQLENKIEVGLKIIAHQRWIEENLQNDTDIQTLKEIINTKSDAAAFYDKIRLGELAQNFFQALQEKTENEVYLPLSSIATSSKLNPLSSEKMLLNAAFLIDRANEEEFDRKINELYSNWVDKVEFKYTGPWPVYNFVNIRLRIEGDS